MKETAFRGSQLLTLALGLVLAGAPVALGQSTTTQSQGVDNRAMTRTVTSGEKLKIKGTIVDRDAETFIVREDNGQETTVLLTEATNVKSKGGFLRAGQNYDVTNLLRGLVVEVEGRGNASGQLAANRVRFDRNDLKVARSIETRVSPVEGRVSQVEAENRSLAGQVDELNDVSKQIRADTDRANAGVSAANERISALDDYDVQDQETVLFKVNSAILTEEAKTSLDQLAQKAIATKGYVIEVAGFTDTTGSVEKNRALSQKRADAVVRYFQENYDIPLRRMITPYGYGELKAAADNTTREGREQNRRVEVKILVSRGLTQQQQTAAVPTTDTP